MLAEAAVEVRAGTQWWLSADEEALLGGWNERHTAVSAIEEQLREKRDLDKLGGKA